MGCELDRGATFLLTIVKKHIYLYCFYVLLFGLVTELDLLKKLTKMHSLIALFFGLHLLINVW